MSQILTASRLKAARSCARLHRYRYVDHRVPVAESGSARFGTLFHKLLEHWWSSVQSGDERLVSTGEYLCELDQTFPGGIDEKDSVIAFELLCGYHHRWIDEPLVTQLVEHEFEMPLVNPETGRASRLFVLRGRIDAKCLDDRDKRSYLVEHKTTGSMIEPGSEYWRKLRMDGQVSLYYSAFPDVAGCIYDVIHKPLLRLKAGETMDGFAARLREDIATSPEKYFQRAVVVRLDSELREHQQDAWNQAQLIAQAMKSGIHPRNPDACIQYGRMCGYFDVCTGVASIDDDRLFQIREPHPELSHAHPDPASRMERA